VKWYVQPELNPPPVLLTVYYNAKALGMALTEYLDMPAVVTQRLLELLKVKDALEEENSDGQ